MDIKRMAELSGNPGLVEAVDMSPGSQFWMAASRLSKTMLNVIKKFAAGKKVSYKEGVRAERAGYVYWDPATSTRKLAPRGQRILDELGIKYQTESGDPDVSVSRFPEVTRVTNFLPTGVEKTLKDIPLPSLTTNIDRAAFRLSQLGVLTLDPQGAAWHIYLSPHASAQSVDAAIEMAREALIPNYTRSRADRLAGYKPPMGRVVTVPG